VLARNKMLLYKVESTKGTDAAPVAGSDLILPMGDLQIAVQTDQDTGAGELKGTFGPGASVTIKQTLSLDVESRVRGLGQGAAARTQPDVHPLLMASGHAVTTSGNGTSTARSAQYKPTSVVANLKTATAYLYEDGLLWKLIGAVNDLQFTASMDALKVRAKIQSKYTAPTTAAVPALTAPTERLFRMTSTLCTLSDGASLNVGSFTFDAGVSVEEAYETGLHEIQVVDRDPMITIDPRAVATAAEWTALSNATSVALTATFVNELGETLVFFAPKAVPKEITRQTRAGQIVSQRVYSLKETTWDDQYTITWTAVL
jgi:hypothetical protein